MSTAARVGGEDGLPILASEPSVQAVVLTGGGDGVPLAGHYHPPGATGARALGVVVCNPLGYEAMSAHRSLRHLACKLAEAGFPVLRFDYRGTGDSSEPPEGRHGLSPWVDDIRTAVREMRARSGLDAIAVVGLRFGASLALKAVSQGLDVAAIVAWAPVVSGRVLVRELRAFRMLTDPGARRADGGEEVGGYLFPSEMLADMADLDLRASMPSCRHPGTCRMLIVARAETPSREEMEVYARGQELGVDITMRAQPGYAAMMRDDPYDSVVPVSTLEVIASWLTEGTALDPVPHALPARRAPALVVRGSRGAPGLRETSLQFGPGRRLFGVVTEPEVLVAGPRPAIVLLNVGADSHVGPHRMNVLLARDLARRGYQALRFDIGGVGESLPSPEGSENKLYDLESVDDVASAMTAMGEARGVRRFVLVGLCSGAFLAFHAAAADPRVVGQVLVNMFAFEWKEGDAITPRRRRAYLSNRSYVRSLLDVDVWRRALRGEVDLPGVAGAVASRLMDRVRPLSAELRALARGRRLQTPVQRAFHAMGDRGVHSLMVFSDRDGGLDMLAPYLGVDARRMRGRAGFAIEIASGVDHTFASLASQERLRETVARYLAAHFA